MADKEKTIKNTYTTYVGPDDLFTIAEQIDQCCEEVNVDICADVGRTEIYYAADSDEWEEKLDELKAKYKNAQSIIVETVGPNGPCGKKYTRWTENRGCCDGVSALVWDEAESVNVMSPDSSGVVVITGGRLPLSIKIRGVGFYLDASHKIKDGYSNSFSFRVFTNSDACGTALITVSDGCSEVVGDIKSTNGSYSGTCYAYDYIIYNEYPFSSPNVGFSSQCTIASIPGTDSPSYQVSLIVYAWSGTKWLQAGSFISDFLSKSSVDPIIDFMGNYYKTFTNDTTEPYTVNPCGCVWGC